LKKVPIKRKVPNLRGIEFNNTSSGAVFLLYPRDEEIASHPGTSKRGYAIEMQQNSNDILIIFSLTYGILITSNAWVPPSPRRLAFLMANAISKTGEILPYLTLNSRPKNGIFR
jgi:hypothetical protein